MTRSAVSLASDGQVKFGQTAGCRRPFCNQKETASLVSTFRAIPARRAQVTFLNQPDLAEHKFSVLHRTLDHFLQDRLDGSLLRNLQE